ncbi:MAG: hypothetical protein J6Z01_02215 [Bacteroidales bacterium]|nr:hypothetical protein [Bacteroidales bacterium]
MKQFDFKRFWMVLINDFFCIKDLFFGFATASLLFVLVAHVLHSVPEISNNWVNTMQLIAIILLAVFPVITPFQLRSMSTNQRCMLLLLPASNVEKFVSKLTLVWFIPIVFSAATYFLMPHSYGLFANMYEPLWISSRFWVFTIIAISGMHTFASLVFKGKTISRIVVVALCSVYLLSESLPGFMNVMMDGETKPVFPFTLAQWIVEDNDRITVFQILLTLTVLTTCGIFSYKRFKRLTINL